MSNTVLSMGMRLGFVGMMMAFMTPVMAAPSKEMLSRHEGKISGYYGAVMVVTKERIEYDNATLRQLGIQHRIGPSQAVSNQTVYEADEEAPEPTSSTRSKPTLSKRITMAEWVAQRVRVALVAPTDDPFLVASNWE